MFSDLQFDEMRKADKGWKGKSEADKQDKYVDTALLVRIPKTVLFITTCTLSHKLMCIGQHDLK